jgi:hypothetical protein
MLVERQANQAWHFKSCLTLSSFTFFFSFVMEQRISYIFIYYIGHLLEGVAIFDATGTNLQQKLWF